jgi:hypothetical protein
MARTVALGAVAGASWRYDSVSKSHFTDSVPAPLHWRIRLFNEPNLLLVVAAKVPKGIEELFAAFPRLIDR